MSEQVTIPFQPYWFHKILTGLKTCTSRTKRYGRSGDRFSQFGANFTILSVEKHRLYYIANNLYKEEGCDSPEEFKGVWLELHPRKGWVPTQVVWVHFFRKEG